MKVVHVKDEYDVFIGRPGPFGNPFRIGKDGTREEVIEKFRRYFYRRMRNSATFVAKVCALRGKRCGCFCKPHACHGDVIAEWVNRHGAELEKPPENQLKL